MKKMSWYIFSALLEPELKLFDMSFVILFVSES